MIEGFIVIVFLGFVTAQIFVHRATREIANPTRRPLQDYHQDWILSQSDHGIRIKSLSCLDGKLPCLVVEPDAQAGPGKRGSLIRFQLTAEGIELPPFGTVNGNLLLLHGRKGRKEDLLPVAERFCAAGFRCLLVDLPGHGESPIREVRFGSSEFESSFALPLLEEVSQRLSIDEEPFAIWGMSMGGAYATRVASVGDSACFALVIVSSFDDLGGLIREQSRVRASVLGKPLALAVRENVRRISGVDPYDIQPSHWAGSVEAPVLVAHGNRDSLISLSRGKRLLDSFASPEKEWVVVDGANHGDVLVTPMPLYAKMARWFIEHQPAG